MSENPSWKELYGSQMPKGANRVKYVRELLEKRFPQLKIEKGYLAERGDVVKDVPHEKHEADLKLLYNNLTVCHIEVSGTDKEIKPPDGVIWILEGKYKRAEERKKRAGIETWFFMVYRGNDYVLDMDLVEKFKDKVWTERPYGEQEQYIHIPCKEAYPKQKLFQWIKSKLST